MMYDIDSYSNYVLSNKCLPAFEDIELNGKHDSLGSMVQKLWETVEVQAIHIYKLNNICSELRKEIKLLKKK